MVILTAVAYDFYIGGDAWEELRFADRFLTTVSPLVFVLAAVGLHRLVAARPSAELRRRAVVMFSVLTAGVVCALLAGGKVVYWLSDGQWSGQTGAIVGRLALPLIAAAAMLGAIVLRRLCDRRATSSLACGRARSRRHDAPRRLA